MWLLLVYWAAKILDNRAEFSFQNPCSYCMCLIFGQPKQIKHRQKEHGNNLSVLERTDGQDNVSLDSYRQTILPYFFGKTIG